MADFGLLFQGLASGLNSGMQNYREQRKLGQQRAMDNAKLAQMGMQSDSGGNVSYTPAGQQQLDLQQKQLSRQQEEEDPTSPRSEGARKYAMGILKAASRNQENDLSGLVQPGWSAADIQRESQKGILKPFLSGEIGLQGKDAMMQAMAARFAQGNDIKERGLGLREDAQASRAADTVHHDKQILTLTQGLDRLDRGRPILDQNTITNQELNDYQQEIQGALTGAQGGGGLGKLERTEYTSLQGKIAGLKQYMTGQPQDAAPRELVERLKALADHTREVMVQHRSGRASSLNRNFAHNPAANEEMGKAIQEYAPSNGILKSNNSQQDSQAVEWAKSNPKDPRSAIILKANGM